MVWTSPSLSLPVGYRLLQECLASKTQHLYTQAENRAH